MTPQEQPQENTELRPTEESQAAPGAQEGQQDGQATAAAAESQAPPAPPAPVIEPTEEEIQRKAVAAAREQARRGELRPANHTAERVRRLEIVVDGILEKAGSSYSSPISAEDAAQLREFLRNGEIVDNE